MEEHTEHPDLRVLLVGRTGLDAALRLDPGIELVRVRTALEAIGELSDPIDETSPSRAVIIVGPDADPGPGKNGHAGRHEFVSAARLVDPAVRVLRALDKDGTAGGETAGFDGTIDPRAAAPVVTAVVRERFSTPSPPAPHRAPAPSVPSANGPARPPGVSAPAHTPAASPAPVELGAGLPADRLTDCGDAVLVRALLRGGDLLVPALAIIRARTTDEGVRFVRAGQAVPEAAVPVAVEAEGATYGVLWSERTLPEELRLHAEWLALWLRLGDQQAQLRDAAFTDSLTGAWNRRYFDRYLTAAIQRARAARQPVTVMCFDIDDFKRFNDTYGHAAADEILIETVRLLRSVIRPSDRVCRVGGDEFAVIFHEPHGPRKPGSAPPGDVFDIARRFQEQVCQQRFPKLGVDAPGTLTVSGGLATFPWDGSTPEELIRHADMLALESKRAGKNAIVFGPGPGER